MGEMWKKRTCDNKTNKKTIKTAPGIMSSTAAVTPSSNPPITENPNRFSLSLSRIVTCAILSASLKIILKASSNRNK